MSAPTWSDVTKEIAEETAKKTPNAYDFVRRRYLSALNAHTKRDTILYATRWTQPGPHFDEIEAINEEDLQGFLEVTKGLTSKKLDIILHSPGGSAEATEALVSFLRSRFDDIRVIVPHVAMSAATIWACAANRVTMGTHSFLGPIDAQMVFDQGEGPRLVPAQAILDQWRRAKKECADPDQLNAWIPMLRQYGPALLEECENAQSLGQELVKQWLRSYMFAGRKYAARDALRVAKGLSDHKEFRSHRRHLNRDRARSIGGGHIGLVVDNLESDPVLERNVLGAYYAFTAVFGASATAKIIENQNGRAFIKAFQLIASPTGVAPPGSTAPPAPPVPPPPGPP